MPANQRTLSIVELRALLSAFKQQHGAEYSLRALGYFGSYAHNTATPDSDVDIVFETDNLNLFLTAMMKQDLEAVLEKPVDVLHLRGLTNSRLKARIEQEAVYV